MKGWGVIGVLFYDDALNFDSEAMTKAYFEILRRNDAFRIQIIRKRGRIRQYFQNADQFPKPDINCNYLNIAEYIDSFNKITPPKMTVYDEQLTRAEIIQCQDGSGGIVIWQHHICSDGYSQGVIIYRQICELYEAYKNSQLPSVPKKFFSYYDYCQYESEMRKDKEAFRWCLKEYNHHVNYFRVPLKPVDQVDFSIQTLRLTEKKAKEFDNFVKKSGCSDSTLVIASAAMVINSITKAKRFGISLELHGRSTFVQKNTAGCIIKSIYVFCDFVRPSKINDFLQQINRKIIQGSIYSNISYVERFYYCLLQSIFSLSEPDSAWMVVNNLRQFSSRRDYPLKMVFYEQRGTVRAIDIHLCDEDGDILIKECYLQDLISTEKAIVLMNKFEAALNYIMENPDNPVEECTKYLHTIE